MKITVEISDSEIKEVCRVTGEREKGPAIRKLVVDALLLKRRATLAQKFISGEWGVELKRFEEGQAAEQREKRGCRETLEIVMATLIDTSLWIDFTRSRSPQSLKRFIAPFILHPEAHLAEPVAFEVLRHATPLESKQLLQQFQTLPLLSTPPDLWRQAADLGQACRQKNIAIDSLDLLIAAVALRHQAELITFDADFQKIAAASSLQIKLLKRPTP